MRHSCGVPWVWLPSSCGRRARGCGCSPAVQRSREIFAEMFDHISVTPMAGLQPGGSEIAPPFLIFQNANACRNMFGVTKSSHSRMRTRASCTRAPCTHAFAAHEGGAHRGRHCAACAPPRPRSLPCALRTSTRVHRALGTRAARVRAPRRRRPCSHTATHACTSKAGCDA